MSKILVFLFVFVGLVSAQTSWTKYDKQEGRYTKQVKADSSAVMVYIMNSLATEASVALLTPSTNSYSTLFTTAGTVKDSVSWGFTSKYVTFINDGLSTDTLFVSTSSSFPATNRIIRLGGEGFTKHWSTTKLYFKVGTTPLASKKIRVEAN